MSSNYFVYPPPPPAPLLATQGHSVPDQTSFDNQRRRGGRGGWGSLGHERGAHRGTWRGNRAGPSQPVSSHGGYASGGNQYFRPSNPNHNFQRDNQKPGTFHVPHFNGFGPTSIDGVSQLTPMGPPIRTGYDAQKGGLQSQICSNSNSSNFAISSNAQSNTSEFTHPRGPSNTSWSGGPDSRSSHNNHRSRGRKRGPGDGFVRPQKSSIRSSVAPAVPCFGGPLPITPKPQSTDQGNERRPKKRKRKNNQLGLTPQAENNESSEEDDVDEESRLAPSAGGAAKGLQQYALNSVLWGQQSSIDGKTRLQISYKGHVSTLQNLSDIAAWIEERKRRFPTKARALEAAEHKRQLDNANKEANTARKHTQQKERKNRIEKQKQRPESGKKRRENKDTSGDAATKAKRKIEKLRRELERQEELVARVEAQNEDVGKSNLKTPIDQRHPNAKSFEASTDPLMSNGVARNLLQEEEQGRIKTVNVSDTAIKKSESSEGDGNVEQRFSTAIHPLTPISPHQVSDDPKSPTSFAERINAIQGSGGDVDDDLGRLERAADAKAEENEQMAGNHGTDSSSDVSSFDCEDYTSSSGSSSSGSDSENQLPELISSKRQSPIKVAPPKREKTTKICQHFLNTGRCKWGDMCKHLHELPKRGKQADIERRSDKSGKRPERVTLYQRVSTATSIQISALLTDTFSSSFLRKKAKSIMIPRPWRKASRHVRQIILFFVPDSLHVSSLYLSLVALQT